MHQRHLPDKSPPSYRAVESRDWRRATCYVLLATIAIVAGALVLTPLGWPYGMIIWILFLPGGALVLLVRWHASVTAYQCAACRHQFEISPLVDFLSPHLLKTKYLRCPACRRRTWARVLMRRP